MFHPYAMSVVQLKIFRARGKINNDAESTPDVANNHSRGNMVDTANVYVRAATRAALHIYTAKLNLSDPRRQVSDRGGYGGTNGS